MNRVIGTVPDIEFPTRKDYVVEYNGDWWVGSSTVYRSLTGARCPYEGDISCLVKEAEFQVAAGRLKLNHYSYADILDMYEPVKDGLELKRKRKEYKGLLGLFMFLLLPIITCVLLK